MIPRVARDKGLAIVVCLAIVSSLIHPQCAVALTSSTTVRTAVGIAWTTPIEHASDVRFVNSSGDGAASTTFVMRNPDAPATYSFALDLPDGTMLINTGDGGFDVMQETAQRPAKPIARLDPPWARDAAGRDIPTWFTVDGGSIVQHVDARAATFPITADPKITWGWVTGTIYFNKSETNLLATSIAWASSFAGLVPGWGWLLVGLGSTLVAFAKIAANRGRCVKIKVPTAVLGSYTGGYCK